MTLIVVGKGSSLLCVCSCSLQAMSSDEVPEELEEQCTKCHVALAGIEQLLQPVMAVSRTQMEEKLDSLDAASEILLLTYTMNSLFWVYLATHGVDPKSHLIKRELERVQKAMKRARQISDRKKRVVPRLNTSAAKRFVRNALWEEGKEGGGATTQESTPMEGPSVSDGGVTGGQRKRRLSEEEAGSERTKRTCS